MRSLFAAVLVIGCAHAPPGTSDFKMATGIRLDGRMDESAWQQVEPVHLSLLGSSGVPSRPTEVRVLPGPDLLWIGFQCTDPLPISTFVDRDDPLWQQEVVEVFLEPVRGSARYLEVEVSPEGVLFDAWVDGSDGSPQLEGSTAFDHAGLKAGAFVVPDSWTVELVIPFEGLPDPVGDVVGLNLTRIERIGLDNTEYQSWADMERWFHEPDRFREVALPAR